MSRPRPHSPWYHPWIVLFAWLSALPAGAANLVPDKTEIAVGETTYIKLEADIAIGVKWSHSPELTLLASDSGGATVKGVAAGSATVTAKWLGGKKTARIEVGKTTQYSKDEKKSPDWGNSGPALQRLSFDQRRMADLLRAANQALTRGEAPDAVARQFYADLARLNIPSPMVALNDLKKRLTDTGLADAALGERFDAGGTPVERAILVYRRDLTMESIRAAVADVARSHGVDVGSVFLAKIGKWAVQKPDMFTLAGDIDFSFVGARPEIILALRDAYKRQITERSGGLDMVAIDSVATAHGFAEHMVYMGIQGRKFADDAMMGMEQGVEQIDFRNPDATGTPGARQISGKQALIETVLEETGRQIGRAHV
jgi:hypothetical protein